MGEAELMWLLPVFCFVLFPLDKALLFIKVQGCSPRELVGMSWKKITNFLVNRPNVEVIYLFGRFKFVNF